LVTFLNALGPRATDRVADGVYAYTVYEEGFQRNQLNNGADRTRALGRQIATSSCCVVEGVEGVVEGLGRGDLARSSRVDVRASPRESGFGARLARRGAQT